MIISLVVIWKYLFSKNYYLSVTIMAYIGL